MGAEAMPDNLQSATDLKPTEDIVQAADDGRNIDPGIATLAGEAAGQRTSSVSRELAVRAQPYSKVPSEQSRDHPTYYDLPVLKPAVWIWSIPAYFYVGGLSGVTATLGAAAQVLAPDSMRSLVTHSRWIATVGGAISSALLVHDLGRPERFLHMLRVFRVRSPMSMGSWILATFATSAGAAAVLPRGPKLFRPLANVFGLIAGVTGLGLSGYTGVLLSQSAVPVWHSAYRLMPVLFLASGTASAASFFEFLPLNESEASAVERFGLCGKGLELAAAYALEADVNRVERVGRPLREGLSGFLWNTAKALTIGSAVLSLLPGNGRQKRVAAGLLGSAASICLRFGIFYAGNASARDPRATFERQRRMRAEPAPLDR
jgi:formate-dependent nitrite reductase membrane component NrfD